MRVSLSWILEAAGVELGADPQEVSRRLTAAGLEVESVEQVGQDIQGVVVAEVTAVEELAGFKKPVRYCQVSTGNDERRGVVCGAVNFSAGDRVPLALPGARLPGGFEIGARKTYGHMSEGMICSAAELGLGDDHSGILVLPPDAPLGADFAEYGGLADHVLDIAVTPDRGYALSVRGVSRELATSYRVRFTDPAYADLPADVAAVSDQVHPASIEDPTACDRFVLREVRGFNPGAPTPLRMRVRLARSGLRSVSLAVDITNYLMLELGQPLHAFDADRLSGPLVVRRARPGEKLETLDHVLRDLDPDDVVIADSSGAISMAGTMGGLSTEISGTSANLVIEAAHFDARSIARESRRHRLLSEASYRFERGVDRELPLPVTARAVALLAELGGGTAVPGCSHAQVEVPQVTITMPVDYPDKVAGTVYGRDAVLRRLHDVGCEVAEPASRPQEPGTASGTAPRPRDRGYRREPLPAAMITASMTAASRCSRSCPRPGGRTCGTRGIWPRRSSGWKATRTSRCARRGPRPAAGSPTGSGSAAPPAGRWPGPGMSRCSASRSIPPPTSTGCCCPQTTRGAGAVVIANPLNDDEPLMRTMVLPGLLRVLVRNIGRGFTDVGLFETGHVFLQHRNGPRAAPILRTDRGPTVQELATVEAALPDQPLHIAAVVAGERELDGWWGKGRPAGWQDAIEAARQVLRDNRVPFQIRADHTAPVAPGPVCRAVRPGRGGAGMASRVRG